MISHMRIVLSDAEISKIQPNGKIQRIADLLQRDLYIVVPPAGDGRRWYRREGQQWIPLGAWPEITCDQIRANARKNGTLRELITEYRHQFSRLMPKTVHNYTIILDRWEMLLGHLKASEISHSDVKSKLPEGSGRWRNQSLAVLNRVFTFHGIPSPCQGIERERQPGREEYMSEAQVRLFWQACIEAGFPHGHTLRFALATGFRIGEIFAITPADVDTKTGLIHIKSKVNRNGRSVYINKTALSIVKESIKLARMAGMDKPFPESGNQYAWLQIRQNAHLGKRFRRHSIRHTFASNCVASGMSLEHIGQLLGHEPGSVMTSRYAHLGSTRKTTQQAGAVLEEILGGS